MKMNGRYSIVTPVKPEEWNAYYQLRFEILRQPWGQSFDSTKDETEDQSLHYMVVDEFNDVIGAVRLQLNSAHQGQVRSMAVKTGLQQMGIGSQLLKHIEHEARLKGITEIILDSREPAVPFYRKNGYEITGPSYLLFGVIPHWAMRKILI